MKRILVTAAIIEGGVDALRERFEVTVPAVGERITREYLMENIGSYDAVLSMFYMFKLDAAILDVAAAGRVKIISNFGVGCDNIDIDYATSKGIVIANTPDPVTEPTAELAQALMLAAARRVSFNDRLLRLPGRIRWGIYENMGVTLTGKTLGIIGMGRIGQSLARRAVASGMKIIYNNRKRLDESIESMYGARYVDLSELLSTADVVSLNAPSTPETYHILGAQEFKAMKQSAIVVNTARGVLIDEMALIDALDSGEIRAAALDVFEHGDGHIPQELLDSDKVVLTPHIGTQTIDARLEMARYASQNIINFFDGKTPLSQVNKL